MKKLFVSMMVACMALTGGVAMAQNPNPQCEQTSCSPESKDAKGKKDKKKEKKKDKKGRKHGSDRLSYDQFEGLNLTPDQQQRLQILREGLGPVILPQGDSLKNMSDEQKQQLRKDMMAKKVENKKTYLNGVKEILEPEQYMIFLENFYINAPEGVDRISKPHMNKKDMKKPEKAPQAK